MTAPPPTRKWPTEIEYAQVLLAGVSAEPWERMTARVKDQYLALARAGLARLRPAFDAATEQYLYGIKHIADERDALRADLARKDEALRACVKTLEHVALVNHMHCITVADQLSDLPHSGDFGSCPAPSCDEARTILLARAQEAGR